MFKSIRLSLVGTALAVTSLVVHGPNSLHADWDWALSEAGVRGGSDFKGGDNEAEAFEIYAIFDTGHAWTTGGEDIDIQLNALIGIGALRIQEDTSATLHFGPALELRHRDFPLSLTVSSGPAWLMDDQLGTYDLGTQIQFASAAGLSWEFHNSWVASYTYRHLSNAGLDDQNPGVNTNFFGIGRRF